MPGDNIILCDTKGVVYKGRTEGMNQWKSAHAVETSARTLAEAMDGADVVFGLSAKGALTPDMIRSMAPKPIIFAMANPDPEVTPEEVAEVRDDAIVATGRSDYPNQVNNVLGFPYIFRGALDVRAISINEEMKIAAAERSPRLPARTCPTRSPPPTRALRPKFGTRLHHPGALRPAPDQRDSGGGGARRRWNRAWRGSRSSTWPPTRCSCRRGATRSSARSSASSSASARAQARRLRRGRGGAGDPRRRELRPQQARHRASSSAARRRSRAAADRAGIDIREGIEIHQCAAVAAQRRSTPTTSMTACSGRGYLFRDCQRLVNTDRNALRRLHGGARRRRRHGHRRHPQLRHRARRHPQARSTPSPGHRVIGVSIVLARGRTVLVADTAVHEMPTAEELADIAVETAAVAHAAWATSRASPCSPIRPSASRQGERGAEGAARR